MNRKFVSQIEVRAYELDGFGHVNNAVYLNYFEVARWKMLAEEDVTFETFKKHKRWPAVAAIDIKYLRPCHSGDTVTIETEIHSYRRSSMVIHQRMSKDGKLVSKAEVTAVIVNEKGIPAKLTPEMEIKWKALIEMPKD